MKLAIFGASGRTGRETVRQAAHRGHAVRAMMRTGSTADQAEPGIEYRQADILKDDLSEALRGCDAVISAVGIGLSPQSLLHPPPLHTEGTSAILAAMRRTGILRLVTLSACFVAGQDRGPPHFRAASIALDPIFTQMGEMEHRLRSAHDIEWTAIRPGWLLEAPMGRDCEVTPEVPRDGNYRTGIADLANFMLECVERGRWIRQTPTITCPEPERMGRPQIDPAFANG